MDQQQSKAGVGAPEGIGSTPAAQVDAQTNRDIAALSYVWILSVIVYFTRRDSPFIRFHARQGIVLFLLSIVLWPLWMVGQFLELIVLALAVLGFLAAAQGQWKELPIIGPLARFDMVGMRASWRSLLDSLLHGWHEVKKDAMKSTTSQTPSPPPSTPTSPAPVAPSSVPPVSSNTTPPTPPSAPHP